MFRKIFALLLSLIALSSAACAQNDVRGMPLPDACPQRVVCLYGSFAEAWLEAGGTLVGVTDDAVKERGLAIGEDVQIVGTNKAPNPELILALDPDLVICSADIAAQASVMETLEAIGVRCAAFRVDTHLDYAEMMRIFTVWTGRTDVLTDSVALMLAAIDRTVADSAAHDAPTVLLLRAFSGGAKAKGADNLAGAMLRDLGCDNIADRCPSLLEELTLESIVAENPEHIFISIMGSDEQAALDALNETLGSNPAWQALDAVAGGNVHVLPKELFHYKPNSRWAESYDYLYDILFEE